MQSLHQFRPIAMRALVLLAYAADFYWLVYLPSHVPHGTCMDFTFLVVFAGLWPLFWCGAICIPGALYSHTLKSPRSEAFRERLWIAAGFSLLLYFAGFFLLAVPAVGLLVAFFGTFAPYWNAFSVDGALNGDWSQDAGTGPLETNVKP